MAATPYQKINNQVADDDRDEEDKGVASEKSTLIQGASDGGGSMGSKSNFLRLTILVAVTLQNTSYALVRRYSRGHLQEKYSTSSALLAMELVKLLLSMHQVICGGHPSDVPEGSALSKFGYLIGHSWKMLVPAVIYLVMNILGFLALGHLDASTFSIVAQMKVFTTATFSVLILGRQLHYRKWRALATLTLGVILISNEAMPRRSPQDSAPDSKDHLRSFAIGMAASFGDVVLSGFVSIYFEMVCYFRRCLLAPLCGPNRILLARRGTASRTCTRGTRMRARASTSRTCLLLAWCLQVIKSKSETYSVWDRNFQLAFWSSIIYTPIMLYDNPKHPFTGWSLVTCLCAGVGALGGVLVALSIKYTDSIMKTIATTGSIVLTTVLNAAFLHGPFTLPIWAGALIVVIAVFSYNDNGDP